MEADNDITCTCNPGFTGQTCAVDVNECLTDQPCQNQASCVNTEGSFFCMCPPSFTGEFCDTDIDECEAGLCENGASCLNQFGGFDCMCLPGFTGLLCGTIINFCSNDSCSTNGRCVSMVNGFECICDSGFTGASCETDINDCKPANPCQNNGMCVDGPNTFTCICDNGFTGSFCGVDVDECQSLPCENGGTCIDLPGGFSCSCPPAFTGPTCGNQTDFCMDEICYNGGTCSSTLEGFQCQCPGGWSGDRCEFPDNVVTKLDSCGFVMASDMLFDAGLVDDSGPLSINRGSPAVSFQYNLAGAQGLYFSGWVWQAEDTNSILFSFFGDDTDASGQLSSNLVNQNLKFDYLATPGGTLVSVTFENAIIRSNTWMHIALAVFNDNSIVVNVDGVYSQRGTLQAEGSGDLPTASTSLTVPAVTVVNIGRGLNGLSSAEPFSGLVRGIAINRITETPDTFNLDSLQRCTLNCVGGNSECLANGQCNDLFGPDRICRCPFGLTGLRCQHVEDRFSFDGSGFARITTEASLDSIMFDFKTSQSQGELYSHANSTSRLLVQLIYNSTVYVDDLYCGGLAVSRSVSSSLNLNDLQYHNFSLSGSLQLDGDVPVEFPVLPRPSCSGLFMSSVLLGSHSMEDHTNSFQGCLRGVVLNGEQLDSRFVQLSPGAEFGCSRDTAQFYTFSHLELPQFISRESQTISMEFSTRAPTGIMYFSKRVIGDATGTTPNDFIAIHIQQGRAVFTFNLGEQNQNVVLRSTLMVNDGEWHSLTAIQNGTMASFYLDGNLVQAQSMGPLELLDTTSNVFVGGVPAESRLNGFNAFEGFDGCIRDLEQNGVAADLQGFISRSNVRFGVCN